MCKSFCPPGWQSYMGSLNKALRTHTHIVHTFSPTGPCQKDCLMNHPATLQTLGMNNTVCHILPQEGPTVYTGLPPLPLHNETIPCSTLTPILKPQQMQGTFYGLPFTLTGFTQQNHPLFHLPSPQLLLYTSGLCLLTHEYRCSPTYKHLEIGT